MGVINIAPGVYEFILLIGDNDRDDFERYADLMRWSRMPPSDRFTKRFSTFEILEGREPAYRAALALAAGEIQPPVLLLYGATGRSKTHLAQAIAWSFLAQLQPVVFWHVGDLLDALRHGFGIDRLLQPGEKAPPESADVIKRVCMNRRLLVLDDLMMVEREWASDTLDTIVNQRYANGLATVITSNTLTIPDRILSRCQEGKAVLCEGEDYRAIIARRKDKR
jgi:DNA replication protein DnaC